jgi:hypothetical protein
MKKRSLQSRVPNVFPRRLVDSLGMFDNAANLPWADHTPWANHTTPQKTHTANNFAAALRGNAQANRLECRRDIINGVLV